MFGFLRIGCTCRQAEGETSGLKQQDHDVSRLFMQAKVRQQSRGCEKMGNCSARQMQTACSCVSHFCHCIAPAESTRTKATGVHTEYPTGAYPLTLQAPPLVRVDWVPPGNVCCGGQVTHVQHLKPSLLQGLDCLLGGPAEARQIKRDELLMRHRSRRQCSGTTLICNLCVCPMY